MDQNGLAFGSVFEARMSCMMKAAWGLTAWRPGGVPVAGGQSCLPFGSVTDRRVVRGISLPELAIAPYAPIRSMKWTSTVPIAIDAPPGFLADCQTMPICLAKL